MIKIEETEVFGWKASIRGMRNAFESWDKSDSLFNPFVIGANDLELMKKLSKAGNDHAKFLRMINVTCDITAPLYWWKEFDTYKVGTVANSCSTMHCIHKKEFTPDDFSCEHLIDDQSAEVVGLEYLTFVMGGLNKHRRRYLETNDKKCWWQIIQLLPTSYNQKRTVQMNYQVLKNMYHSRKNHKLDEWREFCNWCETLPYFKEICL